MAEQWQQKDTLRQMTSKFNTAVYELEDLKQSSTQVNQATEQKFTEMQQSMTEQFTQVNEELDQKISDVTAADIGLGEVDNTPDLQKPVSELQKQAINTAKTEAMAEMLTSEEEQLTTPEGEEPAVSPIVESLIREIVQELGAESGITSYGTATKLVLGVVKASDEVEVDPETGRMTVNGYSLLKEKVQSLINGVGSLEQLSTTVKTDIVSAVNELFQSVSDGKKLVSSAITDRGVATQPTATFQQMANNIATLGGFTENKFICHVPREEYLNNLANLPYQFQDGQAVLYKGEIHVIGGIVSGVSYGTRHYKYDGTNWIQLDALPKSFYSSKAAVITNLDGMEEIHIFGGTNTDYYNHYKWDGTNWTSVSTLPEMGKIVGVAVVKEDDSDVIHIFSGVNHYLMRYGIGWIEWIQLESFPYLLNRGNSTIAVLDNLIYVLTTSSSVSTTCNLLVLSGKDRTICDKVFTPVNYSDYSESNASTHIPMNTYNCYPHLVPLKKLQALIVFTGQYSSNKSSSLGRTFVRGVRPVLEEEEFNTLFAYETGYNGGEFIIDEEKQKIYIIGGSSHLSTTRSFIDINYEIFAKIK